ncbi:hypothetical protein R3P38DRAFT_3258861 [Favolaschia claudopus]|uniref:Uncharacterized protein n=1 Tax=Favolaschia claudopus TaxID=2862362 RepID=A0AAW0D251_9AGAR
MIPTGRRVRLAITLITLYLPFLCPLLFVEAHIHRPSARHNILAKRDALSDSGLPSASWIWTAQPMSGNVAFLRTFASAAGKTATSATISMTAVNQATVWVNGGAIGITDNGANSWKTAEVFSAGLNASTNTFSVLAVNNPKIATPDPGFLIAIQVKYSDGSGDSIVSDGSWTVSAAPPTDFPLPADTSKFVPATVLAAFGSGSWGKSVTAAAAPSTAGILTGSTWIWDSLTAAIAAAAGTIGFRKTVATPGGKIAQSATILMTADNDFQLFVNGEYIGQAPGIPTIPSFTTPQRFTVDLNKASNVFTVFATNIAAAGTITAGPAGLAGSITIKFSDGTTDVVFTDATWLTGPFSSPDQFLAAADSTLARTFALGAVGAKPWGAMTGISDALAAPKVPAGPFTPATVRPAANSVSSVSQESSTGVTNPSSTGGNSNSAPTGSESETGSPPDQTSDSKAGDNSTSKNNNPNNATSSTNSTPIIVGVVLGILALLGVAGLFLWRRRRNENSSRHSRAMSRELFDAAYGVGRPGGSSQPATSRRTSISSAAHSEMMMVQPQQPSYMYNYPHPPVMLQGVYVQPPPPGQSYPQAPLPAVIGHAGNTSRLVVVGEPPLSPITPMQHHMSGQQMAAQQQMASRQMAAAYDQIAAQRQLTPQMTARPMDAQPLPAPQTVSQPVVPPQPIAQPPQAVPSKMEREEMVWRNNAAAGSSSASGPATPTTPTDDAYGGYEGDNLAPPPSYSAQSPLHMQ